MPTARGPAGREAAWKFPRCFTSAEGTALMVRNTGYVQTNQIAIDEPRWLAEFDQRNPLFQAATRRADISIPC